MNGIGTGGMAIGSIASRLVVVVAASVAILAVAAQAQGRDDLAQMLAQVSQLDREGRFAEAVEIGERAVDFARKRYGEQHNHFASALSWLGIAKWHQGHYDEAASLVKRALVVREKVLGPEHREVAILLNNLANIYRALGRISEVEPLYKRSLAITERAKGPEHPGLAAALNNLGGHYGLVLGQYDKAEPLLRRSLRILEKAHGPNHPNVGTVLNVLATVYVRQGRFAEAEPLYQRTLSLREKVNGRSRPSVATTLNDIAKLYEKQGRYEVAEPLYMRSLAIYEKSSGPEHPDVAQSLGNLAELAHAQGHWSDASNYWRLSTDIVKRRAERGLAAGPGEGEGRHSNFEGLVRATYRLTLQDPGAKVALATEMFEVVQWAESSEAAASIAQMSARSAKGSPELARLLRERQDLVSEWETQDERLIAAKSQEPVGRDATAEKALADRLVAINTRLAAINARLARDFPDYAALARPAVVSTAEVQALLGTDEALVVFLDTPEWKPLPDETFIWIVTKTEARWVRSDFGTAALTREVGALRCGLDVTAWDGGGKERCAKALGVPLDKALGTDEPPPFDHARAHRLYTGLFDQLQDLIKGKHLLIVPSGPLAQLPFQVLMARPPGPGDHRAAAWLTREHAITVLPAVSSLKALRRVGRPSSAPRPMIGIGNPLLVGSDSRYASLAKQAQAKERCPEQRPQQVAARSDHRAGPALIEMRGGIANVSDIRRQVPLPETADELCSVAQDVGAQVGRDILLGTKATEREVKRLSTAGELAKYRIVHFATHGVLAGELRGTHEPGLILTPPDTASEDDDGYLSASEIAALKLDADWVVLSACNTAAGGATNAEALSGLGRAFIYAGARSLLVSHWAVDSDATVKLITGAVREMSRDPKVGRAEAMRRSMLALIDKGSGEEAHPAFWAPFVVVGEGASGR